MSQKQASAFFSPTATLQLPASSNPESFAPAQQFKIGIEICSETLAVVPLHLSMDFFLDRRLPFALYDIPERLMLHGQLV